MLEIVDVVLIAAGYLLGSIASAVLVSRLMGLPDPRTGGSGNPGATNVLRLGGRKAALFTLAGDVAKGLLPVALAGAMGRSALGVTAVAIAAFLGHLYPLYFRFKGGKGVATALGALLGISWLLGSLVLATWLACAAATRYSSLSALVAALAAPGLALWTTGQATIAAGTALISALLVWRHRANVRRLLNGTEGKIGATEAGTPAE